jgi:membrane protease YdiL (CAAX protease family)
MQPEDLERLDVAPVAEQLIEQPPDVLFIQPEPVREPFWDYFDLLLFLGLGFASLVLVNLAAFGWVHFHPKLKNDLSTLAMPIQYLAYGLIYLCFYVVFKLRYDRPVFRSLGFVKTHFNLIAGGAGGVLLAFGLGLVANFIHTPKVETPFDELAKTPFSLALLGLTAIVTAPLVEEAIFRGFLQPLFSRTFGMVLGIGFTALLFGCLHAYEYQFAWQYVAAIGIVGVALGTLRAKTNSTIPGTVMHGCFNAVAVVGLIGAKYHLIDINK